MREGGSEKEVVRLVMKLKLRDEKRHQRELKKVKNREREGLKCEIGSYRKFSRTMSRLYMEANKMRKIERKKYQNKANHLRRIRENEEEKKFEICPAEIKDYEEIYVFNKEKIDKMKKEKVEIVTIDGVELDEEEKALLSLPPKFALRRRLCSISMQTDIEMAMAKVRYQVHREDSARELGDDEDEKEMAKKRKRGLNEDEMKDLELMEKLDAEGRRVYDPINKVFDHGNKRATDMTENKKVTLPKPCDNHTESSIEILRKKIMETFKEYRRKNCTEKGEQETNLTRKELRGLRKLKKRIRNKEIIILKTDKSGKLTPINRDNYEKIGKSKIIKDEKIGRKELRSIEKKINAQVRMWTRILNSGANHKQTDRIMTSKQSSSENTAPMYFTYKDHKKGGGYRPVVSGCNSDTLGLSNTLSEVIESVCMSTEIPYEVVSSEDMLSRIYECNERIKSYNSSEDRKKILEKREIE